MSYGFRMSGLRRFTNTYILDRRMDIAGRRKLSTYGAILSWTTLILSQSSRSTVYSLKRMNANPKLLS